jgi:hypothetical protein
MGFALLSMQAGIIPMNIVNKLTIVMVTGCVLFEVLREFSNIIYR